ncbi:MAG: hypothetical protein DRO93_01455 [Candidatus Thorarchaeota archaeon]|nr:MAG: hypothetical protein DRO93_01455 [Candidatus Thorarchaeota archaeon]
MSSFDRLAIAYDNAIDWESRLSREIPFIESYLPRDRPGNVLDLACGSGRHLVRLGEINHNGLGIDHSSDMIRAARALAMKRGVDVLFEIKDMRDLESVVSDTFDTVLCVGNSLAQLPTLEDVRQVLSIAARRLRSGGHIILQTLNFEEIRRSGFRFFPLREGRLEDGRTVLFVRFFEHDPDRPMSTLVMAGLVGSNVEWSAITSTQQVLNLDMPILKGALNVVGFSDIRFFGNYDWSEFNPEKHRSMVCVASH